MSVRNQFVLLLALASLAFLAACGNSNGGLTTGTAPPSGAFGLGNLNGTYVFSVSGTDFNGFGYAIAGTLNADGSGKITGGVLDMNDAEFTQSDVSPLVATAISGSSTYTLGKDGRGQASLGISGNPLSGCGSNNITLDFVMQDSFHGQVTEFDCMATGSGTIDVQTAGVTPSGSYAFSMSGAVNTTTFATVGNFTLTGSSITGGLEDFNLGGVPSTNSNSGYPVSGSIVAGGSASSLSSITTATSFGTAGTLTVDVYPIDSTHLKLIEVDSYGSLSGDAYTESASFPSGNLVFTLSGFLTGSQPFAAGGLMVASGGTIGTGSSADYNDEGNASQPGQPAAFTGSYSGANGRFPVTLSSFIGGTDYVAYPSSGGTFLMETDGSGLNIESGVAYTQTTTSSFNSAEGYGLNLTGVNLNAGVEIDDVAEFSSAASGSSCNANGTPISSDTLIGVTDENNQPQQNTEIGPIYAQSLCGLYTTSIDTTGRVEISYATDTINSGIEAMSYTVDGTLFPFIEIDGSQVSTGAFIQQNAAATSQTLTRPRSLFIPRPMVAPHAAKSQRKLQKQ